MDKSSHQRNKLRGINNKTSDYYPYTYGHHTPKEPSYFPPRSGTLTFTLTTIDTNSNESGGVTIEGIPKLAYRITHTNRYDGDGIFEDDDTITYDDGGSGQTRRHHR